MSEPEEQFEPTAPSQAAIECAGKVYDNIRAVFPGAVADFEAKWDAWEAAATSHSMSGTLPHGSTEVLGAACLRRWGYAPMKALGPKIIPLIVTKLAGSHEHDKNLIGVYLYLDLEKHKDYVVAQADDPINSKRILHTLSNRIVELNLKRYKKFRGLVKEWKEFNQTPSQQRSAFWGSPDCDAYWDIADMETGVLALAMVEYARGDALAWHNLIHQIIHGHEMRYVVMPRYFPVVSEWFNHGDHVDAPKYMQSSMDRQVHNQETGPDQFDRPWWGTMEDPSFLSRPVIEEAAGLAPVPAEGVVKMEGM